MASKYKIYESGVEAPAPQLHGLLVVDNSFFKKVGQAHGVKLEKGDTITLITGKDGLRVESKESFGRNL